MSQNKKVRIIFLDEYGMYPLAIGVDTFSQVEALVQANIVCQVCGLRYSEDRPKVVKNTCLPCFMQSDVVKRENKLEFIGPGGAEYPTDKGTMYHFVDAHGKVYQVNSEQEYNTLEVYYYATLRFWGFIPPDRYKDTTQEHTLSRWNWRIYGDFMRDSVVVAQYKEDYTPYVHVHFLLYRNGQIVEVNKRKRYFQQLFKQARTQLEATKDASGMYHLPNGDRANQLFDTHLYYVIATIVSKEYEATLK